MLLLADLKRIYEYRSRAVHTGQLPHKTKGVATNSILDNGCNLAARIIRRILRDGSPNWDSLICGR